MADQSAKKKFYITTPIYYANSRPHVGSAYTTIVCDVIARYKKMCGYDVAYLTGTDEHGVNIERAAEQQGITPQQLVDKNEKIFRELWDLLGIQYTDFVRTTSPEHARAVQQLVLRTLEKSPTAIEKKEYEGRYCIYDNLYVTETDDPTHCPICGRPTEMVSEENYFFRLGDFEKRLLEFYEQHPDYVQPAFRFNEVKSFVRAGLKDVSISRRTIKWGVPWPGDPEQVFYVWYDALTSYMSGIGYASDDPNRIARFERFWPADVHMIGKEIIRFHAVYWPAFLMAAFPDKDFKDYMPSRIQAHGWLLFEQEKMSKSKGNVAYPEPIVKVLGNDALRYYLLRETVFGQDGNFSREALFTRYEADLVSGLGNLASRVLALIESHFGGALPNRPTDGSVLSRNWVAVKTGTTENYEAFRFSLALNEIWTFITMVDNFLTQEQPWKKIKLPEQRDHVGGVLYEAAEAIRFVSILAHPVIPDGTQAIWRNLGQSGQISEQDLTAFEWGGLKPGTRVSKPAGTFPRVDYKEALERIEVMENEIRNPGAAQPAATSSVGAAPATAPATVTTSTPATAPGGTPGGAPTAGIAPPAAPASTTITIDDFAKIDLRVGIVKTAERIPGADKLLKLQVDLGSETRQILSGIAPAYTPEELVGRKVVVVANLAPRKMRGLESAGMILAASDGADGKPILCTFADEIAAGAKVK